MEHFTVEALLMSALSQELVHPLVQRLAIFLEKTSVIVGKQGKILIDIASHLYASKFIIITAATMDSRAPLTSDQVEVRDELTAAQAKAVRSINLKADKEPKGNALKVKAKRGSKTKTEDADAAAVKGESNQEVTGEGEQVVKRARRGTGGKRISDPGPVRKRAGDGEGAEEVGVRRGGERASKDRALQVDVKAPCK